MNGTSVISPVGTTDSRSKSVVPSGLRSQYALLLLHDSKLQLLQPPQPQLEWHPADRKRQQAEDADTRDHQLRLRAEPAGAEAEHQHRRENVKEAQHQTQRAAEAADNFVGIR